MTLTPAADGTHVRWAASWDETLGGRIALRTLRKLYPQIVADLVTAAENSHSLLRRPPRVAGLLPRLRS